MAQPNFYNPQSAYKSQAILTASPMELIVMLYDGLRKNLLLAQRAMARPSASVAHRHMTKAQDIVEELINSLDMSVPMSEELIKLYDFMLYEMRMINLEKKPERVDPLLEIVDELRSAWRQVLESSKKLHIPSAEEAEGAK